MTDARAAILSRIRAALTDHPAPVVPRDYQRAGTRGLGDVDRFTEVLRDYRALVRVTDDVPATIAAALADRGAVDVLAAPGCPPAWGGRRGPRRWTNSTARTPSSPPATSRSPTRARSSSTTGPPTRAFAR
ncbi:hypothetical protein ACFQV2_16980 [Actinokineospora soli]|uniref:Lactate utilization protein C n=1 Tax=Actinokineospora soli TaxID=1048753 RepID=A0ABW2TPU8_9PSEU